MLVARRRWLVVGLLVIAAALGLALRRGLVLSFFPDGAPGHAPSLTQAPPGTPLSPPAERVRVVLVDGLGAELADALPEMSRLCATGLDVRVDNGFPTVSLPVQHVLWTGRAQMTSGVMYRIPRLTAPPVDALPLRIAGSVAVAESHREIVHSFGFTRAEPPIDADDIEAHGSVWREQGFAIEAGSAVMSDAPLVFVHVLRVDEAGHAAGASSIAYREAALWADALLGVLHAADPRARWFLLSDHGHRDRGGHGGSEPEIRIVRGCMLGPGIAADDRRGDDPVHLVDLHREITDALGVGPAPGAIGRPLSFALAHPDPGATLPRPRTWETVVAWGFVGVALVLVAASVGRRVAAWPWWIAVALGSVIAIHGVPSLSQPVVYPPLGGAVLLAAAPGAIVLAVVALASIRRDGLARTLVAQLAPAALLLLAALTACGALGVVLGLNAGPPLVPRFTALASVGFSVVVLGAAVVALVVAVSARR
jgi:hypothetical protein